MDASNILKPAMARGEIQIIGATTLEEYRKHIEKDAALERRFQPVTVEPASVEQTIKILKGLRPYYESHHQVQISDEALEAAARLSDRYVNDRFLPEVRLHGSPRPVLRGRRGIRAGTGPDRGRQRRTARTDSLGTQLITKIRTRSEFGRRFPQRTGNPASVHVAASSPQPRRRKSSVPEYSAGRLFDGNRPARRHVREKDEAPLPKTGTALQKLTTTYRTPHRSLKVPKTKRRHPTGRSAPEAFYFRNCTIRPQAFPSP